MPDTKEDILNRKKEYIINTVKLGMDFFGACMSLGLTDKEIESLESDEEMQREIKQTEYLLEKELLDHHKTVCEMQIEKGNAQPLQWKLERINPEKWGGKSNVKIDSDMPMAISFNEQPAEKKS